MSQVKNENFCAPYDPLKYTIQKQIRKMLNWLIIEDAVSNEPRDVFTKNICRAAVTEKYKIDSESEAAKEGSINYVGKFMLRNEIIKNLARRSQACVEEVYLLGGGIFLCLPKGNVSEQDLKKRSTSTRYENVNRRPLNEKILRSTLIQERGLLAHVQENLNNEIEKIMQRAIDKDHIKDTEHCIIGEKHVIFSVPNELLMVRYATRAEGHYFNFTPNRVIWEFYKDNLYCSYKVEKRLRNIVKFRIAIGDEEYSFDENKGEFILERYVGRYYCYINMISAKNHISYIFDNDTLIGLNIIFNKRVMRTIYLDKKSAKVNTYKNYHFNVQWIEIIKKFPLFKVVEEQAASMMIKLLTVKNGLIDLL